MTLDYRKIMNILAKGNKWQFDIPVQEQLEFLESHGTPKNDLCRSFLQYKAQMLFVATVKRIFFNFGALLAIPLFIFIAFIKRIAIRFQYKSDAILEKNTHSGVIPTSLSNKYRISSKEWNNGWSLGISDLPFLLHLFPYLFRSPYFYFKISYKVAIYSTMIKSFKPNAIIVFNEYSFTSSALTYYCESRGIKHIDVMHGEKLLYIRDSFFRFTNTYVWEPYYIELFSKMKAPKEQFIPELPPFMSIDSSKYKDSQYYSDYTYYLARYNETEIIGIVNSMLFAKQTGKIVKYRPHPRYSDLSLLRKYVDENDIEYPEDVDIMVSVSNTECAVGVFSTVLNQAYHAGKLVLVDDMNFPQSYSKLGELEYSLLNKPIKYLSALQK